MNFLGSTHPDTDGIYKVTQDVPLIPFPAGLMTLISATQRQIRPENRNGVCRSTTAKAAKRAVHE